LAKSQNSELEQKLQGRTLKVYLYLQRKGEPSGIREVQRDLGLSSPSVADYQVEKLVEMGLASRDSYGRVSITKHVKVKELQSYISLGNFTVPRLAFYASIFTAIVPLYVAFNLDSLSLYGVAVPAVAAGIFWYEAVKMWKLALLERPLTGKKRNDNSDFWHSLVPGPAALAVFVAASFYLFYYVEPSGVASTVPPVAPEQQIPLPSDQATTVKDIAQMSNQRLGPAGTHFQLVSNFSIDLITGLLFAGALVSGFLVYVMVKYRSKEGVLAIEQG
jgi:predicted DNA-binding transcriptional regulator